MMGKSVRQWIYSDEGVKRKEKIAYYSTSRDLMQHEHGVRKSCTGQLDLRSLHIKLIFRIERALAVVDSQHVKSFG